MDNTLQLYVTSVSLGHSALNDFQRAVVDGRERFNKILITNRDIVKQEVQAYVDELHSNHKACKPLVTHYFVGQIDLTESLKILMPNGNYLISISFLKVKKCSQELLGAQIKEGGKAWKI